MERSSLVETIGGAIAVDIVGGTMRFLIAVGGMLVLVAGVSLALGTATLVTVGDGVVGIVVFRSIFVGRDSSGVGYLCNSDSGQLCSSVLGVGEPCCFAILLISIIA